jgi:hypothetical protein
VKAALGFRGLAKLPTSAIPNQKGEGTLKILAWTFVFAIAVYYISRNVLRYYAMTPEIFRGHWSHAGILLTHITGGTLALVFGCVGRFLYYLWKPSYKAGKYLLQNVPNIYCTRARATGGVRYDQRTCANQVIKLLGLLLTDKNKRLFKSCIGLTNL